MTLPKGTVIKREDESALYAEWKLTGDRKIRDKFVLSVYGLIVEEAKRRNKAIPLEDKINAGIVGACRAFDRFDPRRGARYNTYAAHWIRAEIGFLAQKNRTLLSGTSIRSGQEKLNEKRAAVSTVSLDEFEENTANESSHTSRTSSKRVPVQLTIDPVAEDDASYAERRSYLLSRIDAAELTEKERNVLRIRWLSDKGQKSLAETAEVVGVSRQRVQQLERRAFAKIRAA